MKIKSGATVPLAGPLPINKSISPSKSKSVQVGLVNGARGPEIGVLILFVKNPPPSLWKRKLLVAPSRHARSQRTLIRSATARLSHARLNTRPDTGFRAIPIAHHWLPPAAWSRPLYPECSATPPSGHRPTALSTPDKASVLSGPALS